MRVFLRLVAKMSDKFSEQRINVKFCVKLGKNVRGTCAMLSEANGGEAMKKSSVFKCHERFKESWHVEITNKEISHHFVRYQGYCSLRIHSTRSNSQPSLLCGNVEAGA